MTFIGLRQGSRGPEVEYLQNILNKLGFNAGNVDGIFGNRTAMALRRFQRSSGLTEDAIIGEKTWNALLPYLQGYFTYKIKTGDTFFELAKRFNSSILAIETANPELDPKNLQVGTEIIIPIFSQTVPTDVHYGYSFMEFNLKSIATRYPFLSLYSIGKSVMGKELYGVRIGKGQKEIFYNASHHANEWITSVVMMKFIEQFCNAYMRGGTLAGENAVEIYDSSTIFIVPMVNPDGVDLVTGFYPQGSDVYDDTYSINRGEPNFPENWKANIKGVDLNLNYPAKWEEARAYKFSLGYTSPRPFGYVGPFPLSEPETQAVARFTEDHSFRLILAYHAQGKLIFWKFANYNPPNSYPIALEFAAVSGYTPSTTPPEMGNAGYKDWFIQEYNLPGYTIEVGEGTNPLPISQFDEIYKDNIGILMLAPKLA